MPSTLPPRQQNASALKIVRFGLTTECTSSEHQPSVSQSCTASGLTTRPPTPDDLAPRGPSEGVPIAVDGSIDSRRWRAGVAGRSAAQRLFLGQRAWRPTPHVGKIPPDRYWVVLQGKKHSVRARGVYVDWEQVSQLVDTDAVWHGWASMDEVRTYLRTAGVQIHRFLIDL